MRTGIFLIFFTFFQSLQAQSQTFEARIDDTRMQIDGVSRMGYRTEFDLAARIVRKSWWKYSRNFGRPLNMKTYYQVTIPSTENTGNVDLVLLSKTSKKGPNSSFFLTIREDNIPDQRKKAYLEQVKLVLQDFKKYVYVQEIEEQIAVKEQQAKDLSKALEKGDKSSVDPLIKTERQLQALREKLASIYLTWE